MTSSKHAAPDLTRTAWDLRAVVEALADGVRTESNRLDQEQAVRGVDALDEVALHALLRDGLTDAGFGVCTEQRFPTGAVRRRRSEGERCDLVVTRSPGARLLDPLLAGTLFADDGIGPAHALWIEVKLAAQFAIIDGVARPNPRYSAQLLTAVQADIRKLHREPGITDAAVCVVCFTEHRETAEHDLTACAHRCLDKRLPIGAPHIKTLPITERIGSAWCAIGLFPVTKDVTPGS